MRRCLVTALSLAVCLVPSLATAGGPGPRSRPSRSPAAAFGFAAAGTAVGLAVGTLGVRLLPREGEGSTAGGLGLLALASVGPAAGQIYAGAPGRAVTSTLVRAGGIGAIVVAVDQYWFDCEDLVNDCAQNDAYLALALLGTGAVIGATFWDLYDAPRSARRHNARALTVAPTALLTKNGPAPGLAVGGSF